MGCAVNGPGEAETPTWRRGRSAPAPSMRTGACSGKVESNVLVSELFEEIDRWIEGGMVSRSA